MNMRSIRKVAPVIAIAAALTACGGSDSGSTTTATGVFKDTNVSGLSYTSGDQSGTTGANGSFTYEVGQSVTFSIGGVTIGSATGQAVITPVDLVSGGSSSSQQVQNIVRFLLMLDNDGDSSNGINISSAVQTIAETWTQVDFTTSDLATALVSIISDAATADGTTHTLPSAGTAQSHLESTLLCTRAGAYRGTFSGDSSGPFGVLVSASTGFLSGFAYVTADQELLTLAGTTAVSPDQSGAFVSIGNGTVSSGATFSGEFTGADDIEGNWSLVQDTGTFSGSRIGGAADAAYRFTGSFNGDAYGLFTFDVDASDNVTGTAYTVFATADGTTNELSTFTGTVTGTTLNATVTDGGVVDATITGTLNKATGGLSGTWSDADNNSGSFSGSGCQLN